MKDYIGDGVYASDEIHPAGIITLTTGDHREDKADNIIHMEPEVVEAFLSFIKRRNEALCKTRRDAVIAKLPEAFRNRPSLLSGLSFDIDNLTRPEVLEVMAALKAGRWVRSESGMPGTLDYSAVIDGVAVRLWGAAPPQSCRVVEEEYVIPESRGVRKRLICSKATPEEATEVPATEEIEDDDLPL